MIQYKKWPEVPETLATKTTLAREGLKPGSDAVATVYQSSTRSHIQLYERAAAVPKRKLSDKQKQALELARKKATENRTCKKCDQIVRRKSDLVNGLCPWCIQEAAAIEHREDMKAIFLHIEKNKDNYIILDTETTGLGLGHEIVEIAAIDLYGNTLLNTFVTPTIPIPADSTKIHGITDDMVKDAPSWEETYMKLLTISQGKTILIYNAAFDIPKITYTCEAHNIAPKKLKSECIMEFYAEFIDSQYWVSLSEAAGTITSHRAINDCKSVLIVLENIWTEIQSSANQEPIL
ncbi:MULTISPECIES: 3'-5' exonuclease [Bacillus cereus group]|uniref:3'-5' exonuclease n=1 Tax=Bacillus cereus group TaxID=86661 RepID=UPI000B4AE800|nr:MULTISPECIES: 3'-5' exonuclease [Bacillus cereus group]MCY9249092.1 3'-5' exonuclease [Bacillus paranthracis]MDR4159449.1 3'-5' exonuclease [Bacillus paranthracis]MDR4416442.1 3'-5' exonuclease [Bacillus paranthracis]MED1515750.1 3'-5' exonuclease [Bacillus paranthracis]MED1650205.1 3'-5' exonuclease [Bacillus pacificus]